MRDALVRAARALDAAGLNRNHAGNLSVRCEDGMLITPSGIPADDLSAQSMVALDHNGAGAAGALKPSSEWRFHLALYAARSDLHAVVHAHPPYSTALACARLPIPAFHYMVAVAGRDHIPCTAYATFGTAALAATVVDALGTTGRACLMANHGMLAAGPDLDSALSLAREVEFLAQTYWISRQAGEPVILDDAEMERVLVAFDDYGQR